MFQSVYSVPPRQRRKREREQEERLDEFREPFPTPDRSAGLTATGWLSETVATSALLGSLEASRAPSEERIRETPDRYALVGETPTAAFLSEDEQTQQRLEDAQDLFTGGNIGFEGDDGGGLL